MGITTSDLGDKHRLFPQAQTSQSQLCKDCYQLQRDCPLHDRAAEAGIGTRIEMLTPNMIIMTLRHTDDFSKSSYDILNHSLELSLFELLLSYVRSGNKCVRVKGIL